jgi:DNA-binding beta-propeller fold protein YncE
VSPALTIAARALRPMAVAIGLALVWLAVPLATGDQTRGVSRPAVAGTGTIYVSTYKGVIAVVDEATEKLKSEIPVSIGIPISLRLSHDRSRLYVRDATYEKVEYFDRASGTSLGSFTLTEGSTKTRIWSMTPDPQDKYLILNIKKYTLHTDRWEIGPPTLVQYDLAAKKIARTIPWPKGEEREGAGVIFSPDGKLMYLFAEDLLIYDTSTFTEVDRWEVSRPLEPGAGSVGLGGLDPMSDEPGFYTGLVTMNDPLQNRRIMGIGRIELAKKKIDFHPVGPARGLGFAIAPDRQRGYGLLQSIEEYELWTFDLQSYRVIARTPFPGRPRMSIRVSSNSNYVYIHTAGNTIDLYDTSSFKLARTITLDGDMTGFVLVPPAK